MLLRLAKLTSYITLWLNTREADVIRGSTNLVPSEEKTMCGIRYIVSLIGGRLV